MRSWHIRQVRDLSLIGLVNRKMERKPTKSGGDEEVSTEVKGGESQSERERYHNGEGEEAIQRSFTSLV